MVAAAAFLLPRPTTTPAKAMAAMMMAKTGRKIMRAE
jgi:hypothetical protein